MKVLITGVTDSHLVVDNITDWYKDMIGGQFDVVKSVLLEDCYVTIESVVKGGKGNYKYILKDDCVAMPKDAVVVRIREVSEINT